VAETIPIRAKNSQEKSGKIGKNKYKQEDAK
jgi:hypothetical protein